MSSAEISAGAHTGSGSDDIFTACEDRCPRVILRAETARINGYHHPILNAVETIAGVPANTTAAWRCPRRHDVAQEWRPTQACIEKAAMLGMTLDRRYVALSAAAEQLLGDVGITFARPPQDGQDIQP